MRRLVLHVNGRVLRTPKPARRRASSRAFPQIPSKALGREVAFANARGNGRPEPWPSGNYRRERSSTLPSSTCSRRRRSSGCAGRVPTGALRSGFGRTSSSRRGPIREGFVGERLDRPHDRDRRRRPLADHWPLAALPDDHAAAGRPAKGAAVRGGATQSGECRSLCRRDRGRRDQPPRPCRARLSGCRPQRARGGRRGNAANLPVPARRHLQHRHRRRRFHRPDHGRRQAERESPRRRGAPPRVAAGVQVPGHGTALRSGRRAAAVHGSLDARLPSRTADHRRGMGGLCRRPQRGRSTNSRYRSRNGRRCSPSSTAPGTTSSSQRVRGAASQRWKLLESSTQNERWTVAATLMRKRRVRLR
jgi:hypothetical protein